MIDEYHGHHGTMVPWYHGTMVPWYHGAMVKLEPCFVTSGVAFRFPELIVVPFEPQRRDLQILTCPRTSILKEDRICIEKTFKTGDQQIPKISKIELARRILLK